MTLFPLQNLQDTQQDSHKKNSVGVNEERGSYKNGGQSDNLFEKEDIDNGTRESFELMYHSPLLLKMK